MSEKLQLDAETKLTWISNGKITNDELESVEKALNNFVSGQWENLGLEFRPWNYSVSELYGLAVGMFVKLSVVNRNDNVTLAQLVEFVMEMSRYYRANPYHSFRHAMDVMYLVFFTIHDLGGAEWFGFSKLECTALLIAAIAHDVEHPGTNNLYQVNAKTDAFRLYGRESPLERQSLAKVTAMLKGCEFLKRLNLDHRFERGYDFPEDMFGKVTVFKGVFNNGGVTTNESDKEDKLLDSQDSLSSVSSAEREIVFATPEEEYQAKVGLMAQIIHETIINTDMTFHFPLLEEFAKLVDALTSYDLMQDSQPDSESSVCSPDPNKNSGNSGDGRDDATSSPAPHEVPDSPGKPISPLSSASSQPSSPIPIPSGVSTPTGTSTPIESVPRRLRVTNNISTSPNSAPNSPRLRPTLSRINTAKSIGESAKSAPTTNNNLSNSPKPTGPVFSPYPGFASSSSSLSYDSSITSPPPSLYLETPYRRFILSILLHACDISNAARPTEIMKQWSAWVIQEFFHQGDMESNLGLPVSPNMGRSSTNQARCSLDFNTFVVRPLFQLLADILPPATVFVQWCERNRQLWEGELTGSGSGCGESPALESVMSTPSTVTTAVVADGKEMVNSPLMENMDSGVKSHHRRHSRKSSVGLQQHHGDGVIKSSEETNTTESPTQDLTPTTEQTTSNNIGTDGQNSITISITSLDVKDTKRGSVSSVSSKTSNESTEQDETGSEGESRDQFSDTSPIRKPSLSPLGKTGLLDTIADFSHRRRLSVAAGIVEIPEFLVHLNERANAAGIAAKRGLSNTNTGTSSGLGSNSSIASSSTISYTGLEAIFSDLNNSGNSSMIGGTRSAGNTSGGYGIHSSTSSGGSNSRWGRLWSVSHHHHHHHPHHHHHHSHIQAQLSQSPVPISRSQRWTARGLRMVLSEQGNQIANPDSNNNINTATNTNATSPESQTSGSSHASSSSAPMRLFARYGSTGSGNTTTTTTTSIGRRSSSTGRKTSLSLSSPSSPTGSNPDVKDLVDGTKQKHADSIRRRKTWDRSMGGRISKLDSSNNLRELSLASSVSSTASSPTRLSGTERPRSPLSRSNTTSPLPGDASGSGILATLANTFQKLNVISPPSTDEKESTETK